MTAGEGYEGDGTPVTVLRAAAISEAGLNVVIITLRDCRGLSASLADAPVMKSFAEVHRAQRLARLPGAAHRALFAGLLPGSTPDPPLPDSSLPAELRELGYQTVGVGHDRCFNAPRLVAGFESFHRLSHEAPEQLGALLHAVDSERPFFAFANLKDTRCLRAPSLWEQVRAVESVDAALPAFLSALPANTLVAVSSDHGTCYGEGNCWGVRDDHPAHRDVFTVRFRLDGEAGP